MIVELFVIGTFWFWLLLILAAIVEYVFIDRDSGIGATATLMVTGLALWLFGNFNVFSWIWHHPGLSFCYGVGYFVVGIIWSFVKWYLWGKERAIALTEFRAAWLRENSSRTPQLDKIELEHWERVATVDGRGTDEDKSPEEQDQIKQEKYAKLVESFNNEYLRSAAGQDLAESGPEGKLTTRPWVRNHKAMISTWISYWPWSVTWAVFDDLVRNIVKSIFNALAGRYQRISDHVFKDATDAVA